MKMIMHTTIIRNDCHIHDLPHAILSIIFNLVSDTRTRNTMSLVCLRWRSLERATRRCITLRGNIRHLFLLPTCFQAVTDLDLSLLSPWGHPLLIDSSPNAHLLAHLFRRAFPSVVSLTLYVRTPTTLHLLAPQWPDLRSIKLLRWHPLLSSPLSSSDFAPLLRLCSSLSSLDLSHFYYWTEDLPLALQAHPRAAASLLHLNILTHSSVDGFKSHELLSITAASPNLRRLLATCVFDHRFAGFVGDDTLLALASNCPRLSLLHLADSTCFHRHTADLDDQGYAPEDSRITHATLNRLFAALPLLEELVLDVSHNVRDTRLPLERLASCCPRLVSLKLRYFHGMHAGLDSQPGGIALCGGLLSLSINRSADLTDSALIAISLGCPRLAKFEVSGCPNITEMGIRAMACNLRRTLSDVRISSCRNFSAPCSLRALQPIRDTIQRLHIDGVWEQHQTAAGSKCSSNWRKLQRLSLWIAAGESMAPLASAGLEDCPALEEIHVEIEGDCRNQATHQTAAFGLNALARYPRLSRMKLDCGGATGYALTAPLGRPDLSMWERFYLNGIQSLRLVELDYWPPQDADVNRRSLSLPAAALLAQCKGLRKLFIHGTANEHLLMFLLRVPSLRDVQLRADYYPAPDDDSSTEMRVASCSRFESALNSRPIPD